MSKSFNGHPNWNAWNIAKWMSSDEALYELAMMALRKGHGVPKATQIVMGLIGGESTPDGAVFCTNDVRRALDGLKEHVRH